MKKHEKPELISFVKHRDLGRRPSLQAGIVFALVAFALFGMILEYSPGMTGYAVSNPVGSDIGKIRTGAATVTNLFVKYDSEKGWMWSLYSDADKFQSVKTARSLSTVPVVGMDANFKSLFQNLETQDYTTGVKTISETIVNNPWKGALTMDPDLVVYFSDGTSKIVSQQELKEDLSQRHGSAAYWLADSEYPILYKLGGLNGVDTKISYPSGIPEVKELVRYQLVDEKGKTNYYAPCFEQKGFWCLSIDNGKTWKVTTILTDADAIKSIASLGTLTDRVNNKVIEPPKIPDKDAEDPRTKTGEGSADLAKQDPVDRESSFDLEEAETWNNEHEDEVKQFKYALETMGYTTEQIEEIVADPSKIRAIQMELYWYSADSLKTDEMKKSFMFDGKIDAMTLDLAYAYHVNSIEDVIGLTKGQESDYLDNEGRRYAVKDNEWYYYDSTSTVYKLVDGKDPRIWDNWEKVNAQSAPKVPNPIPYDAPAPAVSTDGTLSSPQNSPITDAYLVKVGDEWVTYAVEGEKVVCYGKACSEFGSETIGWTKEQLKTFIKDQTRLEEGAHGSGTVDSYIYTGPKPSSNYLEGKERIPADKSGVGVELIVDRDINGFSRTAISEGNKGWIEIDGKWYRKEASDTGTGNPTVIINENTFSYTEDGKGNLKIIDGKTQWTWKEFKTWQNIGQTYTDAVAAAQTGRSLSVLLGLSDNSWRRMMDSFFVHTVLGSVISGNWEESVCHSYIDRPPEGTMYLIVPDGANMVGVGAHIEAEREDLKFVNATGPQGEFFYSISIYVKNPEKPSTSGQAPVQDMIFNVVLSGQRTKVLFKTDQTVKPGQSFIRTGSKMITQFSSTKYNKICIEFKKPVFTASGTSATEVCNTITTYKGPGTKYTEQMTTTASSSKPTTVVNTI